MTQVTTISMSGWNLPFTKTVYVLSTTKVWN